MVAEVILDLNFKENARSWASSPQNFACGARNGRNRPLFLFFLLGARGLPGGGWGGTYREIKNAPPREKPGGLNLYPAARAAGRVA